MDKRILIGGAIAGAVGAGVLAYLLTRTKDHDYIRFENDSLETSIRSFTHAESGTTVDLVGAIHVAEKDYFDGIKAHLDSLDCVLYEAVVPAKGSQPSPHLALLRKAYRIMADELGLAYQMETIDYKNLPATWEHCDMTEDEVAECGGLLYREWVRNSRLYKDVIDALDSEMDGAVQQVNTMRPAPGGMLSPLKTLAAKRLVHSAGNPLLQKVGLLVPDVILGTGVILEKRNAVVRSRLEEITAAGEGKHVGVFFGALHLPDIEKYLVDELGYEHTSTTWMPAWTP